MKLGKYKIYWERAKWTHCFFNLVIETENKVKGQVKGK